MSILSGELVWRRPAEVSDLATNGAVISPREPCPLFTYKPSSHGHGTSGTCRASLASAA